MTIQQDPLFMSSLIINKEKLSCIEINPDNELEVSITVDGQFFILDTKSSAQLLLDLFPQNDINDKLPSAFKKIINADKSTDDTRNSG